MNRKYTLFLLIIFCSSCSNDSKDDSSIPEDKRITYLGHTISIDDIIDENLKCHINLTKTQSDQHTHGTPSGTKSCPQQPEEDPASARKYYESFLGEWEFYRREKPLRSHFFIGGILTVSSAESSDSNEYQVSGDPLLLGGKPIPPWQIEQQPASFIFNEKELVTGWNVNVLTGDYEVDGCIHKVTAQRAAFLNDAYHEYCDTQYRYSKKKRKLCRYIAKTAQKDSKHLIFELEGHTTTSECNKHKRNHNHAGIHGGTAHGGQD